MPAGHDAGKAMAMGRSLCTPKQHPPRKQPMRPIPIAAKKAGDRISAKEAKGIFHIPAAAAAPIIPPMMPPQLMSAGILKSISPDINCGINSRNPVMYAPVITQAIINNNESVLSLALKGGCLCKKRTITKAAAIPSSSINPYEGMSFSLPNIVNLKNTG